MIIICFPRLWEESALKNLVNFTRGKNPFFSIKRVFTPRAPRFPKTTTKGESPLETPKLFFFVRDSYTNEYLLLLQSVGKNFSLVLKTFSKFVKVFTRKLHQLAVYIFPFYLPSNSILFFKASFIKLTRFCCPE